jgi:hypothetical protein
MKLITNTLINSLPISYAESMHGIFLLRKSHTEKVTKTFRYGMKSLFLKDKRRSFYVTPD